MKFILLFLTSITLLSCRQDNSEQTVDMVDLERFMGDWYVISILPNFLEKTAVNGIESYQLNDKGGIDITYIFYKDSPDGQKKVMHPHAEVYNKDTNAEWRVQFFWPVKFPYLIIWLDENYETTVIGVPNRKFTWVMSRKPFIEPGKYEKIKEHMLKLGYEVENLQEMPQIWE